MEEDETPASPRDTSGDNTAAASPRPQPCDRPYTWKDLTAALILLAVAAYVVIATADKDVREHLESASQTFSVFATIGTVAALFMLARQVELQRVALEEQRQAFKSQAAEGAQERVGQEKQLALQQAMLAEQQNQLALQREALEAQRREALADRASQQEQLTLQRQSLDDQRLALDEQRKSSRSALFDGLRGAYAEYLGAQQELLGFFGYFHGLFPKKDSWDARVGEYKDAFEERRVRISKVTSRLALFDRSDERKHIRQLLGTALGYARRQDQLFMDARGAALELRQLALARDASAADDSRLDDFTEQWLGYVTNEMFATVDAEAVKRMQTAAILFAQLALRSSLAADEADVVQLRLPVSR